MAVDVDSAVANMPAEIALPRANGELLFETPWEARAFGLAVALHEGGAFEWKLFSQTLSDEIAEAEKAGEDSTYYERWLRALSRVTHDRSLLAPRDVIDRLRQVKNQNDHEHDHDHPHHHHHE